MASKPIDYTSSPSMRQISMPQIHFSRLYKGDIEEEPITAPNNTSSAEFNRDELLVEPAAQENLLHSDEFTIKPKLTYQRPKHERIKCELCDSHQQGFRGEHELERHKYHEHRTVVKKWLCVEPKDSADHPVPTVPLSKCKACHEQKKLYGAYYNAAAHLRRTHFKPRKLSRTKTKANVEDDKKRGGKAGGDWPPMSELKCWMEEVDVVEDKAIALIGDLDNESSMSGSSIFSVLSDQEIFFDCE